MPDLADYADVKRLVSDPTYAKSKYLTVKKCQHQTPTLQKLEDAIRMVPSDAADWRWQVDELKRLISQEKCRSRRYIIKYDKNYLNADNQQTLGLFRSVVSDGENIIAFAPPKSLSLDTFKAESLETDRHYLEYCEGTMINMYFDLALQEWEVTTRSNVGARCKFYKDSATTFRRMFLEAFTAYKLEFSDFDQEYCYSFVLQHPENRIVIPFTIPRIIVTNIYRCKGTVVEEVTPPLPPSLPVPETLNIDCNTDISDIVNKIQSGEGLDYTLQGAVICDRTRAIRFKVRNPKYEHVRHLKGNNPKKQYQYYSLRQNGRVKEYLWYYPEDAAPFNDLRKQIHHWTIKLWKNYIGCYVNKEKTLREYPFEFRSHIYTLHQKYRNEYRESGNNISRKVVIDYVNNLPPDHLMASINYPLRHIKHKAKTEELKVSVHQ